METEPNSQTVAAQRADQHLRRIKRYRTLAFVAMVVFICFGLLPGLGHIARSARKAAVTLGPTGAVPAAGLHSIELSAFHLGKSVSDYSAMRLLDEQHRPGEVNELNLTSAHAAIEARLSALRLEVDAATLEFTWKPGTFDSPASVLLADALARKYGETIRASYLLGARLMSVRWRVTRLQDTVTWETSANRSPGAAGPVSDNTPAAILAALEAMTSAVIGKVALQEFAPPAAVLDLIRSGNSAADSLLLHLFSLDMAVETRLSR